MAPGETEGRLLDPESRALQAIVHPVICTVADFAARLGLRFTRTTIRETLMRRPEFPSLGLAEIQQLFDAWDIPAVTFRTTIDEVRSIPLPVIAAVDEPDPNGGEGERRTARGFVIIEQWRPGDLVVSHPARGRIALDWPGFRESWTGMMFAAVADTAAAEPGYADKEAAERTAAAAYRDSLRLIDRFLTPEECGSVVALCEAENLFQRSPVADLAGGRSGSYVSRQRTSDTALLARHGAGPCDWLYERAAKLLAVPLEQIERLQCVRYEAGAEFRMHVDGMGRTRTLLVYLNDDFSGGETAFPDLDLLIPPRAGAALLFENLDEQGAPVPWSRHAGLPPAGGRKYALNIWTHE